MKSPTSIAATYDMAYDSVGDSLQNLQRAVVAGMFLMYPDRLDIAVEAEIIRSSVGSDSVEINVLLKGKQITIVSQPDKQTISVTINDTDSLCVLTTGYGEPLAMDDLQAEPEFLRDHAVVEADHWGAWATAPIKLDGLSIGTVCALEETPRHWTDEDEEKLVAGATAITELVEFWMQNKTTKGSQA